MTSANLIPDDVNKYKDIVAGLTPSSRHSLVAARLRYRAADGVDNPLGVLKHVLGLACSKSYRDVFRALADLIDRPACHNYGGENGTNGENYDFACSHCGHRCDISDARFCPRCGAEVVE